MKTAGVIFDFYDDPNGALLKKHFSTPQTLPEIVKEAHILNEEERGVLRDEAYALIMRNEGKTLRKFACVDAGNTFLSALYFLETRESLPEEAQKVAAANIIAASEEFGLPIDPLVKEAAKASAVRTRDPLKQAAIVGDDSEWSSRTNLTSIQGGQDSGKVMDTVKSKTASVVDVTGLEPTPVIKTSSAKNTALGRYPLDSYADVLKAVSYFEDHRIEMKPSDAHEYAVKTASRAEVLGIPVPAELERYGSTEYAPDLEAHLAHRRSLAPAEHVELYSTLQEKRASIEPEQFAQLLGEVDEVAGLHWLYGRIADPYYATFGGNSKKEKLASWSWASGDVSVNAEQLSGVSSKLGQHFDSSIVSAFEQDPVTIFESMPEPQKVIIARLAQE